MGGMGVTSLRPGELDNMLQRRIEQGSDFQGPALLDDTDGVVDTLWLLAGTGAFGRGKPSAARPRAREPLVVFYASDAMSDLTLRSWAPVASAGDVVHFRKTRVPSWWYVAARSLSPVHTNLGNERPLGS